MPKTQMSEQVIAKTKNGSPVKRNREGNIVEKNDGRIYARIQFIDETGRQRDKYRRAENRTQARLFIREMRRELETGGTETLTADKITFTDLVKTYSQTKLVAAVVIDGRKVSGLRSVENTKQFLKPLTAFFGRKSLRTIRPGDIERYRTERLNTLTIHDRQRKISSVNRELELLRAMFNYAVREQWIIRNPFSGDKSFIQKSAEVSRNRVLSFAEEARLLKTFEPREKTYKRKDRKTGELKVVTAKYDGKDRAYLKALIFCALDTAMRRGELFKLRWRDVDLDSGLITVLAENTKTETERIIGITPRLQTELEKLWAISPKTADGLVFGITYTIKNLWGTILSEAKIEDLHFHDLRHTATTRFVRSGLPHSEIMKITGHTQLKTFLRYVNITADTVTNAANHLSAFVEQQQAALEKLQNELIH